MAEKFVTLSGSSILYNDLRDRIKALNEGLEELDHNKVDGAKVVDEKYLQLTSRGEDIGDPLGPFAGGGGGGGSGSSAVMNLTNKSGWLSKTVAVGTVVYATFNWSSTIDGIDTGLGTMTMTVNGTAVKTMDIEQGDFTVALTDYVSSGEKNQIQITVVDAYGTSRRLRLTLSFVSYNITSEFDPGLAYTDSITFTYKPTGIGTKTVHFIFDGIEIETKTISNNASRMDSILIPKSSALYPEGFEWHGMHTFKAYFTVEGETETITSNVLEYELICVDPDNATPIITSSYPKTSSAKQYSNVVIPYYVYNTSSAYSAVDLYIDGELIQSLPAVSRDPQTWSRRVTEAVDHTFTIACGGTSRSFEVSVESLDVDVQAETLNLALHLSSEDRSNDESEESRRTWAYTDPVTKETISAEFNDKFSWGSTDGWLKDDDGIPFLRLKDEDRITIPYTPFSVDKADRFRQNGATFEFEFRTTSVFDYDTDLISCYAGDKKIGFNITAQKANIAGTVNNLGSQYKEDEHVRISFVVNQLGLEQFIYVYINGIISGVTQYSSSNSFIQDPPVSITLGSKDAVLDIYRIRVYQRALSRFQMVSNWIADMQDSEQLLRYYKENNIYDDNDKVSLDKITSATDGVLHDLPYLVIDTDAVTAKDGSLIGHLPTYKGEKLLCSGYYVNPVDPYTSFSWKNGEIDVQGTSSQAYPIKNFKLKIKQAKTYGTDQQKPTDCSGFIMTKASEEAGQEVAFKKYSMRGWDDVSKPTKYKQPRSIETNTFVFKADFASSEGCNNVELVRYYNDLCPYKTPAQDGYGTEGDPSYREKNPLVRQGIDGFPMIWFENVGGKISFIGKYNFNNHKGTEEVYGLEYNGEEFEETDDGIYRTIVGAPDESWEVTDNNSAIALWKRVAGDAVTESLEDSDGKTVDYDDYLKEDSYTKMETEVFAPIYNGTYDRSRLEEFFKAYEDDTVSLDDYDIWRIEWNTDYRTVQDWVSALQLTSVYASGDDLNDLELKQRNILVFITKKEIVDKWNLTVTLTEITPEDDMLGKYGKGESAAHSYEVRFPSEWYDTHVDGRIDGGEVVKMDRMLGLQRWVTSTWPEKATDTPLETPKYGYDKDSADYRRAKFKNELSNWFDIEDTTFYYIYTEAFLMIDSRVKNAFPTYFAITHAVDAVDAETGEFLYEETAEDDVVEDGVSYFKRTGSDTEEDPYVYSVFNSMVGEPTVDDEGNALFTRVQTREETLDGNGRPLGRWCWLPYDMDTGIGINNEGLLVFTYSLEDTEGLRGDVVVKHTDPTGVPVFNGASSVFWNNFREQFQDRITSDYQTLRTKTFRYIDEDGNDGDSIEKRYEDHQKMWPAAIFNEDAYYKYIKPLLETGENRLGMCLGSKEQQRKWWLFNRFRFLDSKYTAAKAKDNAITFRANNLLGDRKVTITPYIDLYVKIRVGEAWESDAVKTYKNTPCVITFPTGQNFGDTEAYLYSADQIKTVEGLNKNLAISTLDISSAKNLQRLDVSGDKKSVNTTLVELHVGGNTLLRSLDARYCDYLGRKTEKHHKSDVDLSKCEQLEEAYFEGTHLTEVKLPEGGRIRTAHLPNTITSLNVENQYKIEDLQIVDGEGNPDTSNIVTLIIRNVNDYVQQKALAIVEGVKTGTGTPTDLTLSAFTINVEDVSALRTFLNKLTAFTKAVIDGTLTVADEEPLDYSEYYDYKYGEWKERFQDLTIDCNVRKKVVFMNYDGTGTLDTQYSVEKSEALGEIVYTQSTPLKPETPDTRYDFDGWSMEMGGELVYNRDVISTDKDLVLYPHFNEVPKYTVVFMNYDGTTELNSQVIYSDEQDYVDYSGERPTAPEGFESAGFIGWGYKAYAGVDVEDDKDHTRLTNVHENRTVYAQMNWEIKESSIVISKQPDTVLYFEGDTFDKTGMEVTVTKVTPDGDLSVVTNEYTCDTETPLTKDTASIEVKVNDVNTAEVVIGIAESMEMTREPDQRYQLAFPEKPDFSGIEFTVSYTNGATKVFTDGYDYSPETFTSLGPIDVQFNIRNSVYYTYNTYVVDKIPESLNDCSWDLISRLSKAGTLSAQYDIGDEKTVEIRQSVPNTYVSGEYTFRIVAFDHNTRYTERTSAAEGTAVFNKGDDHKYDLEDGRHSTTFMLARGPVPEGEGLQEISHYHRSGNAFNDTGYNGSGWGQELCNVRKRIQEGYLSALPKDLAERIITVTKSQRGFKYTQPAPEYTLNGNRFYYADGIVSQEDKVYIPSYYELTGEDPLKGVSEADCCEAFPYYAWGKQNGNLPDLLKKGVDIATANPYFSWWTRSYGHMELMLGQDSGTLYVSYIYSVDTNGMLVEWQGHQTAGTAACFTV